MTQLEKSDVPVNHYVDKEGVLKMVNGTADNPTGSGSSGTTSPSPSPSSTSPLPLVVNGTEGVVSNEEPEEVVIGVDIEGLQQRHAEEIEEEEYDDEQPSTTKRARRGGTASEEDIEGMLMYQVEEVDEGDEGKTDNNQDKVVEGSEMNTIGRGFSMEDFIIEPDDVESYQTPSFASSSSSSSNKRAKLMALGMGAPGGGTALNRVSAIPIALPPPGQTVASACGGNQSYLNMDTGLSGRMQNALPSRSFLDNNYSAPASNSKMPGVVGLSNLGNTCFMNSGLQCLINTPPVVEFFLKSPSITAIAPMPCALTLSFQQLIRVSWNSSHNIIQPREFKETLGNIFSQFKDCRQHDCQEFLALTLDTLHEQLKIWNNSKRGGIPLLSVPGMGVGGSEINSSASCQTDSGCGESTVHDSDVSSSLQSPASGSNNSEVENSSEVKKSRLSDESESSTEKSVKEDAPSSDENAIIINETEDLEGESGSEEQPDGDLLLDDESEDGREKRILRQKAKRAEGFWMNYIRDNNTVIASSYQGMYKSTVTCSTCGYVSCTFEPFMYLSLPIPRVTERYFDVMLVLQDNDYSIHKISVTMDINDGAGQLKDSVIRKGNEELGLHLPPAPSFVVAEVVNYHIHSILKNDQPLKNVKDGIYNVYVIELNQNINDDQLPPLIDASAIEEDAVTVGTIIEMAPAPLFGASSSSSFRATTYLEEDWENEGGQPLGPSVSSSSIASGGFIPASSSDADVNRIQEDNNDCNSCSVCLEDLPKSQLRQHYGCSCILCLECISKTADCLSPKETVTSETAAAAVSTKLKCPVCSDIVDYKKHFVSLVSTAGGPRKMNLIPVLFFYSPSSDSNNNNMNIPNANSSRFIGHPIVVQLPSALPASDFQNFIGSIVPFPNQEYVVKNATWDGKECGACLYSRTCSGCEFSNEGIISINSRNSILISYSNLSPDLIENIEPPTMAKCSNLYSVWTAANQYKEEPPIDIYECLDTFSQTEHLDEHNPWYCSQCRKHQCATKSLTICRFPDYLIVYLKRFVFMDHSSNKLNNKLKFPIEDFDVSKYIAEEFAGGEHIYDLYSCVCHFGSAAGGHYTAYSKNPKTDAWHYFNDDSVSRKCPSNDEYTSGYILFYAKQGIKSDIPLKRLQNNKLYGSFSITSENSDTTNTSVKKVEECDSTTTSTTNNTVSDAAGDADADPSGSTENENTLFSALGDSTVGEAEGDPSGSGEHHQDDVITSTSSYDIFDDALALQYQPSSQSQSPQSSNLPSSSSSDRVKRVGENVAKLSLDTRNTRKRPRYPSLATSTSTSSSTPCTSTSSAAGSSAYDEDFEDPPPTTTYKTYGEYSKLENKRLTRVANRHKQNFLPGSRYRPQQAKEQETTDEQEKPDIVD